jgi:hypothetical protein
LAIIQEPAITINSIQDKNLEEKYYPFTIDILFIYNDRQEIIEKVKISPQKINLVKLSQKYSNPLAIILNYQDDAYMIQKFDLNTIQFFIENPEVKIK